MRLGLILATSSKEALACRSSMLPLHGAHWKPPDSDRRRWSRSWTRLGDHAGLWIRDDGRLGLWARLAAVLTAARSYGATTRAPSSATERRWSPRLTLIDRWSWLGQSGFSLTRPRRLVVGERRVPRWAVLLGEAPAR